jgi:transcriptional regulator with XRE-family HTH domain
MASFGKFIKSERERKGWSQTEFGALIKVNTPLVSRIENDKKTFTLNKLKLLAEIFELDYNKLKDLYFADKFAKDAYKYECSESIFSLAQTQVKYLKEINTTQGKLKF